MFAERFDVFAFFRNQCNYISRTRDTQRQQTIQHQIHFARTIQTTTTFCFVLSSLSNQSSNFSASLVLSRRNTIIAKKKESDAASEMKGSQRRRAVENTQKDKIMKKFKHNK